MNDRITSGRVRNTETGSSSAAALIHWVEVAESITVTKGLSPLLPHDQVTVTVELTDQNKPVALLGLRNGFSARNSAYRLYC